MRRPGFSYIEMLIVIALIVAMATISLNAFRGARDQANFKKAVNDTVSLIEKARNMALNSQQVDGEVLSGYGIAVTGDSIVLFGDDGSGKYEESTDTIIDEKIFATNVTISAGETAVYTPPLADLEIINITGISTTDLTITITSNATGLSQDVTLNTVSRVPEVSTVY